MTLPVHYQDHPTDWPICGEMPISYDSTAHWNLVTCPKCLEKRVVPVGHKGPVSFNAGCVYAAPDGTIREIPP